MKSKLFIIPLIFVAVFFGYKIISSFVPKAPVGINEISATGTVTLAFAPPTGSLAPGSTFAVPINITTGASKVTAVSVEATYDASKLQLTSVTQGSFLTSTLAVPVITSGKVIFTYSVPVDLVGGKTGNGPLATLNFKALSSGTTSLSFGPGSLVAAVAAPGNVLKTANSLSLTIGSTSTPAPQPSSIPSPVTSAKPSPSPLPPEPSSRADLVDTGDVPGDQVNIYDYNKFVIEYSK